MSDNVPFEIQAEIIKRLPVRSLIQFRSVSNSWKSLIDSSDFISRYTGQLQHLLVRYNDSVRFERKYVSIVDDDTFPQHKVSVTVPLLVDMLRDSMTMPISSSHGLLCLYGDHQKGRDGPLSGSGRAVLWNPSIRKAVDVPVPNVGDGLMYRTHLGFGVCSETTDPKIVKITCITTKMYMESISCIPWQVEVFTLSQGAWRSPYSSNLPRKSIQFHYSQISLHGFYYWLATDYGFRSKNLIISFDMTSEEFREVNLPDNLAYQSSCNLSISKVRKSLVVVECDEDVRNPDICLWMMEDDVPKSFKKLFTFKAPHGSVVSGFRETGEPMIDVVKFHPGKVTRSLAVYEPYSKSIVDLGIHGRKFSYFVYSYMETLLLLDQPVSTVYKIGNVAPLQSV